MVTEASQMALSNLRPPTIYNGMLLKRSLDTTDYAFIHDKMKEQVNLDTE